MCVQIKYFVVLTFKHYNIFVYSFCGFGNALSFKTIDDEEINKIEKRVRENGAQFLASHPDKNAKDFFGDVFASNPKKFEFSPGDVKFINQIVAHVKKLSMAMVLIKGSHTSLKIVVLRRKFLQMSLKIPFK